jgi:hypothetical protein
MNGRMIERGERMDWETRFEGMSEYGYCPDCEFYADCEDCDNYVPEEAWIVCPECNAQFVVDVSNVCSCFRQEKNIFCPVCGVLLDSESIHGSIIDLL